MAHGSKEKENGVGETSNLHKSHKLKPLKGGTLIKSGQRTTKQLFKPRMKDDLKKYVDRKDFEIKVR